MACLEGCVYGLHEYSQVIYGIGPTTMGLFIGIGSTLPNALLVKASSGVKKGTKMSKVDLCFSSNKLAK